MEQKTEEKKEIKIKYKTVMKIIITAEVIAIVGILAYIFIK